MKLTAPPPMIGSPPSRLGMPPKVADQFYTSPEWRRAAGLAKYRSGNRCRACGPEVPYVAAGLIADHIIERADGGADFEQSNIQVLCAAHHNTKTAQAKMTRSARG